MIHLIAGKRDPQSALNRPGAARSVIPVGRTALTAMLKQIITNNRAGDWRRLKGKGEPGPSEHPSKAGLEKL